MNHKEVRLWGYKYIDFIDISTYWHSRVHHTSTWMFIMEPNNVSYYPEKDPAAGQLGKFKKANQNSKVSVL